MSLRSALSPQLLACLLSVGSGQLSVRVENRFPSVRASRHRPKACKTTPFPFLLDLYPSRILFCPLCSRRSNRQTFPPLSLDCVQSLSHDTRTHLFARSDSSLLSLVTALAPFSRCGVQLDQTLLVCPRVKILFRSISCTLPSSFAPPARSRGPCGLF